MSPGAKEVVTDFVRRCADAADGGSTDPYALLVPEVDVTVNGTTALSGRYRNRELLRKVLVSTAAERVRKAHVEIADMIAQEGRVATLLRITGESIDGHAYNPKGELCGCTFGVSDGLITEIYLFADTTMIETALFNRRYVPNDRAES